jgi:hypothetical protein
VRRAVSANGIDMDSLIRVEGLGSAMGASAVVGDVGWVSGTCEHSRGQGQ